MKAWLLRNIETEVLIALENKTPAYKVWKSIEEQVLSHNIEKEMMLDNILMTLKKGSSSLDEYLKKFKSVCDSLAAIKKPVNETKKVFQLARGLGPRYQDFRTAMLTKPPYVTYHQFVLSLQDYEQILNNNNKEKESMLRHDQAFISKEDEDGVEAEADSVLEAEDSIQ